MTNQHQPHVSGTILQARANLIRNAIRFANLAAGKGIEIDGLAPEDFMTDYTLATYDEDWDTIADRLAAIQPDPQPVASEPVMMPRYPTQEMMDAGLHHCSEDMSHGDLFTVWTAMFDAVTLDGGTSHAAPATPSSAPASVAEAARALLDLISKATAYDLMHMSAGLLPDGGAFRSALRALSEESK